MKMEAAGSLKALAATELDCATAPNTEIWIFVGVGNTRLRTITEAQIKIRA